MLTMVTGRPGAGKTYETVRYHIIPALIKERKVITNIPCKIDIINRIYDVDDELLEVVEYNFHDYGMRRPFSDSKEYKSEWKNEKGQGPIYVVDEAHLSLPKGKSASEMLEFLTLHRHSGIDIVFVTQNPRQMDRDILNLIDVVHYCVKNRALGDDTTYTKKIKDGYRGEVISIQQRKYQPIFFQVYKSHTMSDGSVTESKASDMTSIKDHWAFKFYKPVLAVGIVGVLYTGYGLFSGGQEKEIITETEGAKLVFGETEKSEEEINPFYEGSVDDVSDNDSYQVGIEPDHDNNAIVKEEEPQVEHPYKEVSLHVVGYVESFDKSKSQFLFVAAEQGQAVFYVKQEDLLMAGYTLDYVNPCMAKISYGEDYSGVLICDTPDQAVGMLN